MGNSGISPSNSVILGLPPATGMLWGNTRISPLEPVIFGPPLQPQECLGNSRISQTNSVVLSLHPATGLLAKHMDFTIEFCDTGPPSNHRNAVGNKWISHWNCVGLSLLPQPLAFAMAQVIASARGGDIPRSRVHSLVQICAFSGDAKNDANAYFGSRDSNGWPSRWPR